MKFRKRPVMIEAVLYNGRNYEEIHTFVNGKQSLQTKNGKLCIDTLEGVITADIGDWIIKGIKGEFYPCKPDVFAKTYEAVMESVK